MARFNQIHRLLRPAANKSDTPEPSPRQEIAWPFGWVASDQPPVSLRTWDTMRLGSWHLAYSPETPVHSGSSGRTWIIGFAIDPANPSDVESQICNRLESLDEEPAHELLNRLTGRYVLLRSSQRWGLTAQQDAMGLRAAYFTDRQYRSVIGSHATLVAGQVHAPIDQYGQPGFLKEANEATFPGRKTGRLGVVRLTPNLEWRGNTQDVQRIFPRNPRTEIGVDEAVNLVTGRVRGTLDALQDRNVPLMVSLSGGMDSRVTAAFLEAHNDVLYFTYDVQYRPKNRANQHDLSGAMDLADRAGLEHRVLALPDGTVPEEVASILRKNWPLRHAPALALSYRANLPNRLHLRSNGFGIASAYWRRHGFTEDKLDARQMRRIASSKRGKSYASLDAFNEFINSTDFASVASNGYDPYDFFLWELRVGAWLSACLHESDIAHDTHVLLNSREMLTALLSVPLQARLDDTAFLEILSRSGEPYTTVPINGQQRFAMSKQALEEPKGDVLETTHTSRKSVAGIQSPPNDRNVDSITRAIEVALRQSDGAGFEDSRRDESSVKLIMDGSVALPPHPVQTLSQPIDWKADPLNQRNWRAQLHMLRWLDPLRRVTRRDPARRSELMGKWDAVVADWAASNAPGKSAAPSAWLSMTDAVRVEALVNGLPWSNKPEAVIDLLRVHGKWLADPRHIGHSNHALRQHSALFQIGAVLENEEWTALAIERLQKHSEDSFDDEGMNSEGAVRYWEMNRRWASQIAGRLEREGTDAAFMRTKLDKAAEALAFATRPDGMYEPLGDSDPSKPQSDGHPHLEYVATLGSNGEAPDTLAKVYSRGYAFGRSGWGEIGRRFSDESFYSLIFGNSEKVHGHEDAGSLTFYAHHHPLLVDAGKFAYVSSPERDYCFSRAGHNVITIDGARYSSEKPVELLKHEHSEDLDFFILEDRGYPGIRLKRTVVYSRLTESLLVVDYLNSNRDVTARWHWHLNPNASANVDGASVHATVEGFDYCLLWAGHKPEIEVVRGKKDPLEGWFSPTWNKLVPADEVIATRRGVRSRTAMLVESQGSSRRRLESFPTRGGMAYVARGNKHVECLIIEGDSVRSIQTTEEALPSLIESLHREGIAPKQPRTTSTAPRSQAQAEDLDKTISTARTVLEHHASKEEVSAAVNALNAVLDGGHDQGAVVALRDIAATFKIRPPYLATVPRSPRPFRHGIQFLQDPDELAVTHPSQFLTVSHMNQLPSNRLTGTEASNIALNIGSLTLPIRFRPGSGDSLLVCFSGAVDRKKIALPRFEWQRQFEDLDVPQMFISDPTLDLAHDLRLGWYLGSVNTDGHKAIAAVVQQMQQLLAPKNTWLLGNSGGGFSAIQVGSYLRNASIYAVNPQTDVQKYLTRFSQRALRQVFGSPNPHSSDQRLSASKRIEASDAELDIRIVINTQDSHHLNVQVLPFAENVESQQNIRCTLEMVEWGGGHLLDANYVVEQVKARLR